jgi:death-on-curing protein
VTEPSPAGHPLGFQDLLQGAQAPGSPRVDDYGVPFMAAARIGAALLGQDVYHGAHMKAAALLDTLLRHRWLEHHQARAAWAATVAQLEVNGHMLRDDIKPGDIAAVLTQVAGPGVHLVELARTLRSWTVEQDPSS